MAWLHPYFAFPIETSIAEVFNVEWFMHLGRLSAKKFIRRRKCFHLPRHLLMTPNVIFTIVALQFWNFCAQPKTNTKWSIFPTCTRKVNWMTSLDSHRPSHDELLLGEMDSAPAGPPRVKAHNFNLGQCTRKTSRELHFVSPSDPQSYLRTHVHVPICRVIWYEVDTNKTIRAAGKQVVMRSSANAAFVPQYYMVIMMMIRFGNGVVKLCWVTFILSVDAHGG